MPLDFGTQMTLIELIFADFFRHSELVSESPELDGIAGRARNDGKTNAFA
jgi:hypothetical protein